MKKFECNACGIRICTAEYQSGSVIPFKCTTESGGKAIWREIKELPKLTAEVFDRPDCPAWARYAAVDKDGGLYFYGNEPSLETSAGEWSYYHGDDKWGRFGNNFDTTDWQNSLIERPVKALPDWVKAGKWGYDTAREEYFEVVAVTPFNVEVAYLDDGFTIVIGNPFFNADCVQAHKRPFNAEEMQKLVGKVIENCKYILWCDGYDKESNLIITQLKALTAEDLIKGGYAVDREPCYVLEHLNGKGEWVK